MENDRIIPKFWFVWNPNSLNPRFKHDTVESATTEAERLARMHPGQEFIVLESIAACRAVSVEWERHLTEEEISELPF